MKESYKIYATSSVVGSIITHYMVQTYNTL